jgi:hypothetical protein
VFNEQHTPEQVTEYEVAREILGRHLGQTLAAQRAATDPDEIQRFELAVTAAASRRRALRVGSPQAAQIVAAAKAARNGAIARE